ncbi:MAG: T9SS type A sorting domain-containing protein [Saprospiraceae bacterium]|nr:T9SS type A sorting domain-containing protein [Saprospiraceae bacterium]
MKLIYLVPFCLFLCHSELQAQCERAKMVSDYETYYLGSNVSSQDLKWTGNADACTPGQISPLAIDRMMIRLNYFRRLAHVSSEIHLDTALTKMCQEAAVMMHKNNKLSHDPPESWTCYTDDGRKAASKSNLALGAHSVNALSLYMRDPGAKNGAVGHRRWILYSRAKDIGLGSTSRAHAMYVIHNRQDAPDDLDYVTYPSEGFFPAALLPERWSFSKPRAKFGDASVIMMDTDGNSIPVTVLEVKNGFGDNTIVWEPEQGLIDRNKPYDQDFDVFIADVGIKDSMISFSYRVTLAPVVHPPECESGSAWLEEDCACVQAQTTSITGRQILDIHPYPNPASEYVIISDEDLNRLTEETTARLYDIYGRSIQQWDKGTLKRGLPVHQIPNGMYILKIQDKQLTSSIRLRILH